MKTIILLTLALCCASARSGDIAIVDCKTRTVRTVRETPEAVAAKLTRAAAQRAAAATAQAAESAKADKLAAAVATLKAAAKEDPKWKAVLTLLNAMNAEIKD